MNRIIQTGLFGCLLLCGTLSAEARIFKNKEGQELSGELLTYDFDDRIVRMENGKAIPLDEFSAEDQEYILKWNMARGLESTLRFKIDIEKENWERWRWDLRTMAYSLTAFKMPKKLTPEHALERHSEYEDFIKLELDATGYTIQLKNRNPFPMADLTVEHKIFVLQEEYIEPDGMDESQRSEYDEVEDIEQVLTGSEKIPVLAPLEEVVIYSESAVTTDHKMERTMNASNTGNIDSERIKWDDSNRERKGKVLGIWVKISIPDVDEKIAVRHVTLPKTLINKVSWEGEINESATTAEEEVTEEVDPNQPSTSELFDKLFSSP